MDALGYTEEQKQERDNEFLNVGIFKTFRLIHHCCIVTFYVYVRFQILTCSWHQLFKDVQKQSEDGRHVAALSWNCAEIISR